MPHAHSSSSAPAATLHQTIQAVSAIVETLGQTVKDRLDVDGADRRLREFADEHPFVAVGSALTLGYLVGRWISRR